MKKFIMGWLKFKPGKRDAFIAASREYVEVCRTEAGCEFFDFSVSLFDPDMAMAMECFSSREMHAAHLETERFKTFWKQLGEVCIEGRFENIFADHIEPDSARFGVPTN